MSAKKLKFKSQNDNSNIALDPPSVIDYNGIPLCGEYPMAGNLTQAAVRSVTTALTITASDHVRLLGVTVSSDLSLEKHVPGICSTCFCWLRQIRRIRRSIDTESATTLVHAFIASGVDYCNIVLAGSPRFITDRLQRVLNAPARVITGTRKIDRGLSDLLHSTLAGHLSTCSV